MANDRRKWYVVWQGTEPGICDSWAECESRVKGFPGARYKAFKTQQEAVEAFRNDPGEMDILRAIARAPREFINYDAIPDIVHDSIAVDGACSGNPGLMEYRGVDVPTGAELFHQGPFADATNNIGEFLAIVHALALCWKQGLFNKTIYSDSYNAILWVKKRKCKTKLERTPETEPLYQIIARAEAWLATHNYSNPIIKWETSAWGEIPADFGRK
jgi:ribonuclease HI